MTSPPPSVDVTTPVLPLRQPPRRLLRPSSTEASARSAASASSFRSRAADLVVRAPISPSAIRVRHRDLHAEFRLRYHPPRSPRATALAFSHAAEARTADRIRSRQSGRDLRRRHRRSSDPRPCPEGDAATRQRLPRSLAATASLGGEAASARSPRAPRALALTPQRPQKADRPRSR